MESPDRDFSETERVALLKQVIKQFLDKENHSSYNLANFVRSFDIRPRWDDIIMPHGRSLGQCRTAFQDIMTGSQPQQPYPYPSGPGASSMPAPMHAPQQPPDYGLSQRPIRPRPMPPSNPLTRSSPSTSFSPTTSDPPVNPAKRGRPNRTESERRQKAREDAFARGEKDPYPSRSRKKAKIEPTSATASQAPSPPVTTRYPFGPPMTSAIAQPPISATYTTAPEAYSYSRAVLPPLHSTTSASSSAPSFPRPTYEPSAYPSTRSLRSYGGPEHSTYRPPSTAPQPPPPLTSRPPMQSHEQRTDDNGNGNGNGNGNHRHGSPRSAEPMEP